MMRLSLKTGDLTLSCLMLSIISGIFLLYQYDYHASYDSILTIDVTLPWGKYLRSFHWYSSQVFFILFLIHIGEHIWRGAYRNRAVWSWIKLVASLPIAALLLFTGYVLKGDIIGTSAGTIAEHLALSIPVFGDTINRVFFAFGREGLARIYVNHVLVLEAAGGWLLWTHLKKRTFDTGGFFLLLILCLAFCVFSPAPMASPPVDADVMLVKGHWFFLGVQELLRYFSPFLAGIMFPAAFLIFICALSTFRGKYIFAPLGGIVLLLASNFALTVAAYLR